MINLKPLLKGFLAIASALLLGQCVPGTTPGYSSVPPHPGSTYLSGFDKPTTEDNLLTRKGFWDGDGVLGTAKIRISLDEQLAYFYRGNKLVGMSPVSTGKGGYETPRGTFKISQMNRDHKSSLYGVIRNKATNEVVVHDADTRLHKAGPGEYFDNAPMPYFMRFNGGVGMHTGFIPGYAASHGCVRLPDHMAKKFFENAKIGTPVVVDY